MAKTSDTNALEELIKRLQKNVYAVFFNLTEDKNDISDLTQLALIKMAKSIKNLRHPSGFHTWLNQIIITVYYDFIRKKGPELEYNEDKIKEIKDKLGCEPGEKCLFSEVENFIKASLLSLPHQLRVSIILREFQGLSYEDIAQITNTTLGTVKSRISRARGKLQKALKDFI